MSTSVLTPSKQVSDTIVITFPFQDQMVFGEVITGAVITVQVSAGVDPNPTTMLSGSPNWSSSSGLSVTQTVVNGLDGNIYLFICTVTTSHSNTFVNQTYIAVINDSSMF